MNDNYPPFHPQPKHKAPNRKHPDTQCAILPLACLINTILLFLSFGISFCHAESPTPYAQDIKSTTQQIKQFENQRKALQAKYSKSEQRLKSLDKKIANTLQQLKSLRQDITISQTKLAKLTESIAQNEQALNVKLHSITNQIRMAHQRGQPHPAKLLLSLQDPNHWNRLHSYQNTFFKFQQQDLQQAQLLLDRLQQNKTQQTNITDALAAKQVQLKENNQRLTKQKQQQQHAIQQIATENRSKTQEIEKLKSHRTELKALLALWKQRSTASQPLVKRKGRLAWPVQGRLKKFRNPKGSRRKGVFIAAPRGNRVKAVHDGQVIFADWLRGYGLMCILDHGDGYLSLYGHNDTLSVKAGNRVKTGEPIGTAGSSGGQTITGTYFELRHNGKSANARQWLARK